ncbi:uncharacterized protein LOC116415837 [Nasonia vitripennis]|uniref:Uncharacterized protein n=1 Tax=Nasonia vitripennis TaxID=7425 RepID=A0A7M7PVH9_NASVI|nr:uncharacterized protein LOC116415829 [Nasonia vitripennis]XP_031777189.1 uncharacterized protein LOC116415837 [Nasonia vitripennis]
MHSSDPGVPSFNLHPEIFYHNNGENDIHNANQNHEDNPVNISQESRPSLGSSQFLQSSEETIILSQQSTGSHYKLIGRNYESRQIRGQINVMTERVVSVLDNFIQKLCAFNKRCSRSLNYNTDDLILNKSSYNRYRTIIRKEKAEKIKKLYGNTEINAAVLHWDGKIIPDSIIGKNIDRLPIVVTNGKSEKIIDVPALPDGKGVTQADAIYRALNDWGLKESIKALCCDTNNSNLGYRNGAAVILEQYLDHDLLYLPCRHHIYEIILAGVFAEKLPGTNGPNVPLFKRFHDSWNNIDQSQYESGLHDINHPQLLEQIAHIKLLYKNR